MAKLKVHPLGFDEHGRALAEICEGKVDGEDAKGHIIACKRIMPGQPVPPGYHLGRARQSPDGHVEIDALDPSGEEPVFEDQSEERQESQEGQEGPAKYNSKAYRDGWERTFN